MAFEIAVKSSYAKENDVAKATVFYSIVNRSNKSLHFVSEELILYINYQWSPIEQPDDQDSGGIGQRIIERFGSTKSSKTLVLEPRGRVSGQMDLAKIIGDEFVAGRWYSVWVELCCMGPDDEGMSCWKSKAAEFTVGKS